MEADKNNQEAMSGSQPSLGSTPSSMGTQQPQPTPHLTSVQFPVGQPHTTGPTIVSGGVENTVPQVRKTQPLIETHQQQPHQMPTTPTSEAADKEQQSQQPQPTPTTSPHRAVITKVKLSDELNLFDWSGTKELINQIAQHAKNSVESVITTLDPGMKEYLYSGGNINIMVICDSDTMVGCVRDAFQTVFGRATVVAARYDSSSHPVKLSYNFESAIKISKEKICAFRNDTSNVPQNQVVVAIQPSIVHVLSEQNSESTLNRPFFTYALLIDDPILSVSESCYSQLIPLDNDIANRLSSHGFPVDNPHNNLGWSLSIEEIMAQKLKTQALRGIVNDGSIATIDEIPHSHWLSFWSGQQVDEVINRASVSLAHMYQRIWDQCLGGDPTR